VEIGSGSGKQAIVLKKVLQEATFLCFNLPLQLFLAYSYTKHVLPDGVVTDNAAGVYLLQARGDYVMAG
jgi:hypothetical protein